LPFALELTAVMIKALHGGVGLDLAVIVVEREGALGFPGDRLGLLELLLAAQSLDGLVEDDIGVLVIGPDRADQAEADDGREHGTEEPLHRLPHWGKEGLPGAGQSARRAELPGLLSEPTILCSTAYERQGAVRPRARCEKRPVFPLRKRR